MTLLAVTEASLCHLRASNSLLVTCSLHDLQCLSAPSLSFWLCKLQKKTLLIPNSIYRATKAFWFTRAHQTPASVASCSVMREATRLGKYNNRRELSMWASRGTDKKYLNIFSIVQFTKIFSSYDKRFHKGTAYPSLSAILYVYMNVCVFFSLLPVFLKCPHFLIYFIYKYFPSVKESALNHPAQILILLLLHFLEKSVTWWGSIYKAGQFEVYSMNGAITMYFKMLWASWRRRN